jgi:DegV family protein with EDD domain
MDKVGIVTDSINCLPQKLIEEYDIRIAALNIIFEDRSYRDQVELTTAEFWKLFHQSEKLPTTAAVSIGDYLKIFHELKEITNDILCIVVSSQLSATFESAVQAKKMAEEEMPGINIKLIDSLTASGALGLIVLEAARAAADGKGLQQVADIVHYRISRVHWLGMIETLYYLAKGGRVPRAAAWAGDLLKLKPLLSFSNNGTVEMIAKVRTKPKAMMRIVDLAKKRVGTEKPLHAIVHYAEAIEEGEQLKSIIESQFNCAEIYLTEHTPVMSTHSGPMFGFSFYAED